MNFISWQFLVFLAITWVCFALSRPQYRVPILLFASFLFYAAWSIPFILVILATTSIDYVASKKFTAAAIKSIKGAGYLPLLRSIY